MYPIIATNAAPMMKGALRSTLDDTQTVVQIDILASAFGGMVNLGSTVPFSTWPPEVQLKPIGVTYNCACQL